MKGTRLAKKVFLLSATPIMNRPEEFANLYAMISKKEDSIKELYKIFETGTPSTLLKMLQNKISYTKINKYCDKAQFLN